MATVDRFLAAYDYKYSPKVWRSEVEESFQRQKQTRTSYTTLDGQIVRTVEEIYEFQSAVSARTPQLPDPPLTFLYADKTYRKDAAYIFQKTHIKTTTYEALGEGSYIVTIIDYDVLAGTLTREVHVIDGRIPLAPTVNSALTNLIQQPISSVLEDNCDFIQTTTTVNNEWLEDEEDAATAARRKLQRETAIVRRVQHAANPLMQIGDTVRLVDARRGLDARHVITRRQLTLDEDGAANQATELEFWIR